MEGKFGVHDGYIHRFTGLKFLLITLRSVECSYLLVDNLTLSFVCPLTAKAFPAVCRVYRK